MGFSNSIVVAAAISAPADEADALWSEQRPQFGEGSASGGELQRSRPKAGARAVTVAPAQLEGSGAVMRLDDRAHIVHDLGRHPRPEDEIDRDRHLAAGAHFLEAGDALDYE